MAIVVKQTVSANTKYNLGSYSSDSDNNEEQTVDVVYEFSRARDLTETHATAEFRVVIDGQTMDAPYSFMFEYDGEGGIKAAAEKALSDFLTVVAQN